MLGFIFLTFFAFIIIAAVINSDSQSKGRAFFGSNSLNSVNHNNFIDNNSSNFVDGSDYNEFNQTDAGCECGNDLGTDSCGCDCGTDSGSCDCGCDSCSTD